MVGIALSAAVHSTTCALQRPPLNQLANSFTHSQAVTMFVTRITVRTLRCAAPLVASRTCGQVSRLPKGYPRQGTCRSLSTCSEVADTATVVAAPISTRAAKTHEYYMQLALDEAAKAAAAGEVPVGAVLVDAGGHVVAAACNRVEAASDPTAHAELLCLRAGAAALGGWRLLGTTLYVTLEPCPMCAGALLQARIGQLVYGARNRLLGADGSWIAMLPGSSMEEGSAQKQEQGADGVAHAAWQPEAGSLQQGPSSGNGSAAGCGCSSTREAAGCAGHGPQHALGQRSTDASDQPSEQLNGHSVAEGAAAALAAGPRHPFHPELKVVRGVLREECSAIMRDFFRARRRQRGLSSGSSGEWI